MTTTRPDRHPTEGLLRACGSIVAWTALGAVANAGLAVVTARQLGAAGRGLVVLVVTISTLTALVVCLGTNTAARHHLVRTNSRVTLGDYLGLAAVLVMVQTLLAGVLGALILGRVGTTPSLGTLVLLAFLSAVLLGSYLLLDALNAYGHTTASAVTSAAGSTLSLLLALWLAGADLTRPEPYLATIAVGYAGQAAVALVLLTRAGHSTRPKATLPAWATLVRSGLPALGLNAGQSMAFRVDRLLIGVFLGAGPVGIYSVAATVSEALRLVPAAFGQVAFHRTASRRATPADLVRLRRRFLLVMAVPLATLAVAAPAVVRLLFGPGFEAAVLPLRILLLGELAIMSFSIDSRLLSGLGRVRSAGGAGATGLVVVLVLDLLFIPQAGLTGAAWASVIAYLAMGLQARRLLMRGPGIPAAMPDRHERPQVEEVRS